MLGSECNLKMSEISGIQSPYKSGAQKHLFQPLHNLRATFTAHIFGNEQVINKRTSELATRTGLLHRLETTWTEVHKRLQIGREFLPTQHKFCVILYCTLCRRRSANGTQL